MMIHETPPAAPHSPRTSASRPIRAYSLIEALIALVIIQIVSTLVFVSVQTVSDSSHLDLLSKRTMGALRYARMLAMSSGQSVNADFDLNAQTIRVYLGAGTTPTANSLFPSGLCAVNLNTDQGIAGCKIAAVTNSPTNGTNIYRCTYGRLGTRINATSFASPMTVSFTYGAGSAVLTIPNAGDAY
jgi:Tfp pilus assembly protein FimT